MICEDCGMFWEECECDKTDDDSPELMDGDSVSNELMGMHLKF